MQESEPHGVRTEQSPEYFAKAVWEETQDRFHMRESASLLYNPCYITHAACQGIGLYPGAISVASSLLLSSKVLLEEFQPSWDANLAIAAFSKYSREGTLCSGSHHSITSPETTGTAQRNTPLHRMCPRLLSLLLARLRFR